MGTQLVRRKALIAAVVLIFGCRPGSDDQRTSTSSVPTLKGRVISILWTQTGSENAIRHEVLSAGGLVRSTDEVDRWRLLDTRESKVIFVDDIARIRREMTLEELRERKQRLAEGPIPSWFPPPVIQKTGQTRRILEYETDQYVIQAGNYRRELWISRVPLMGTNYMALRFGSDEPGGPFPAALARVHLQLMNLEGFPLLDTITTPAGKTSWGVTKAAEAVQQTDIPRARLEVPDEYTASDAPPAQAAPSYPMPSTPR